jgi:hypothetical protein
MTIPDRGNWCVTLGEWCLATISKPRTGEPHMATEKTTKPAKAATKTARKAKTAKKTEPAKKLSQMAAAERVLAEAGEPMNCKAMVEVMSVKGYWSSPGGKTPAATLYTVVTTLPKTCCCLIG